MMRLEDGGLVPANALFMPLAGNGYKRFILEVSLEQALLNAYQMPDTTNLQSIDSYIVINDVLWMFQITRDMNHDVALDGIMNILTYLQRYNAVKADIGNARLVFVVPMYLRDNYRKQTLTDPSGLAGSKEEIMTASCDAISGIGPDRKRKLAKERNISTVKQLIVAYDEKPEEVKFVRRAIVEFKEKLELLEDLEVFKTISQFVIGIDYHSELSVAMDTSRINGD